MRPIELDLMRVKGRAQPTRIYTAAEALGLSAEQYSTLIGKHEPMLASYRAKNWDGAEAAIAECEGFGFNGLSSLYKVYRHRISEWRANPPPADWDGTFTATSK
jgi:adenylate cyclase